MEDSFKQVTPNFESSPVRTYIRFGANIECYKIKSGSFMGPVVIEEKLFTITLESDESAKLLMEDLYYGEYTGA